MLRYFKIMLASCLSCFHLPCRKAPLAEDQPSPASASPPPSLPITYHVPNNFYNDDDLPDDFFDQSWFYADHNFDEGGDSSSSALSASPRPVGSESSQLILL